MWGAACGMVHVSMMVVGMLDVAFGFNFSFNFDSDPDFDFDFGFNPNAIPGFDLDFKSVFFYFVYN